MFRLGQSPGAVVFMAMRDSGKKFFMLFFFPYERHCHHWWLMELYAEHTPIAKNDIFDLVHWFGKERTVETRRISLKSEIRSETFFLMGRNCFEREGTPPFKGLGSVSFVLFCFFS